MARIAFVFLILFARSAASVTLTSYDVQTRALQRMFKAACQRAGLPEHYSIHALRHSWGTYLYQRTRNLRLVQKELRHKSPLTTAVYADVTPEDRAAAVEGVWD